jgi:hypothetical protein
MKRLLILAYIWFFSMMFANSTHCQMWNYLPLTESELGKPFPMTKVEFNENSKETFFMINAGPSGIRIDLEKGNFLSATGKDLNGLNWYMDLSLIGGIHMPPDMYIADLDGNGIKDLVLLVRTGSSGVAESFYFISILFDEKGRPVPSEIRGYIDPLPEGIDALVDMDQDGKSELVYMNFCDGYWITQIYRAENARWHRIQGQYKNHTFPLYTRFTERENRKAVKPKSGRHPISPDISDDTPLLKGRLKSYAFPDDGRMDIKQIIINRNGSEIKFAASKWHNTPKLVLDRHDGRVIYYLGIWNKKVVSPLLDEIISKQMPITLYGKSNQKECGFKIIWASDSP